MEVTIYQEQETSVTSVDIFDLDAIVVAGQIRPSSIAMYKRDVQAYLTFCYTSGNNPLNPQSLALWRDSMVLGSKSPNTINRMLSAVKRTVKEAAIRDMIDTVVRTQFQDVPGVKLKAMKDKLKKNSRTRISKEDMRRLCESPDATTLVGKRDRALLATLASSALRASELATLTINQIEKRDNGYMLSACGKQDIDQREACLSREAKELIDAWLEARPVESLYIFTSFSTRAAIPSVDCLSETSVWRIVQKYAKHCNIEHIKPHDFRRFVGTQIAKTDIRKAQKALGHKSIEVTARHYVLDELEVGLTDNLY